MTMTFQDLDMTIDRLNNCPDELRQIPCWVLWKEEIKGEKTRKVPYYANGRKRGPHGSDEDRGELVTFDKAIEVFQCGDYTGLGIATLPEFGITIGDFDDKKGEGLHPEAEQIANTTYAERSPGGKGVHAIWFGAMPSGKNNAIGVEVFGETGFVTFTGIRLNGNGIEPLTEQVKGHLTRLLRGGAKLEAVGNVQHSEQVEQRTILDLKFALRCLNSDDYDCWIKQGQRLKSLGDVGLSLWLDWASTSDKFDETEAYQRWKGFSGDKTGYPAVFKEAQALGWVNPQSSAARDFGMLGESTTAIAGQESGQPFFVSLGELLANKQPPDWLIHRHIEANSLALLFGPPSAGKSFLAIDWAMCVATGREWNGHRTKQGSVCYLAGEGFAGFRRRCAAWAIHNEVEAEESDIPLYFNNRTIRLIDENSCFDAHQAVNEIIKENGPLSLLVLDTFNRTGGGDENSNTETAQIITNLEKYFLRPFKCSVLIVHHSGHGETERSRGASALPAGVDSSFMLVAKDGFRNLIPQKQKESELGETTTYTLKTITLDDWPLDEDTLEAQNSAVIVPCDAPISSGRVKKRSPRISDALDCLIVAKDTGKSIEPPPQVSELHGVFAPSWCVSEAEWRELFYNCPSFKSDASQEAKRKAFKRAVEDLLELDRVKGSHGYYWPIG